MFVVPRTADSHGIALSQQEVRQLSLTAALVEQACNGQPQVTSKPALLPPPGVHLPRGFQPPPGLSLPSKADARGEAAGTVGPEGGFLQHRLQMLGLESTSSNGNDFCWGPRLESPRKIRLSDCFEDCSDCSTADAAETASLSRSSTPMTITPLPTPMDARQRQEPLVVGSLTTSVATKLHLIELDEVLPPPPPPGLCLPQATGESASAKQVLELVETLPVPCIGSLQCPSVGSIGHKLGLCKPCDFVHRGTCRTGTECKYCHLCGPGMQKQNKKERRRFARAMRSLQGQASTDLEACVQSVQR